MDIDVIVCLSQSADTYNISVSVDYVFILTYGYI